MMEQDKTFHKLKILIYSDHFYPLIGGSENYALDLAIELSRQGHDVGVITSQNSNTERRFSFSIYRIKKPLRMRNLNLNFLDVPTIIKDFRPDVFHINYQTGGENILLIMLSFLNLPFVITYHADHFSRLGRLIDLIQSYTTFKLADRILVQSKNDTDNFLKNRINESKLETFLFNGIDTNKYKCGFRNSETANKKIKALFVGRLDKHHLYKGLDFLLEALNKLSRTGGLKDFSLTIVGEGNLRVDFEKRVKNYGLKNVTFLGDLDDEQLISTYCNSDLLILPSNSKAEGFGRVVLEALSCGLSVIVSSDAGISELLALKKIGLIFKSNNVDSLIQALNYYFEKRNLKMDTLENIHNIVKNDLSLTSTVKYTTSVYKKIIFERKGV